MPGPNVSFVGHVHDWLSDDVLVGGEILGYISQDLTTFNRQEIVDHLLAAPEDIFYCIGNCFSAQIVNDEIVINVSPLSAGVFCREIDGVFTLAFDERLLSGSEDWQYEKGLKHQITVREPFACNWDKRIKRVPPGFCARIDRSNDTVRFVISRYIELLSGGKYRDVIEKLSHVVNRFCEGSDKQVSLLFSGGVDSAIIYSVMSTKLPAVHFEYNDKMSPEEQTCKAIAKELGIEMQYARREQTVGADTIEDVYRNIFPANAVYKWPYHWKDGTEKETLLISGQNADSYCYYDCYNPGSLRGKPGRFIRNAVHIPNRLSILLMSTVSTSRAFAESLYCYLGQNSTQEHVPIKLSKLLCLMVLCHFLPARSVFDENVDFLRNRQNLLHWFKVFKFLKITSNVNYNAMVLEQRSGNKRFFPFSSGYVLVDALSYLPSWMTVFFPKWESYLVFPKEVYFGVIDRIDGFWSSLRKRRKVPQNEAATESLGRFHAAYDADKTPMEINFELWRESK